MDRVERIVNLNREARQWLDEIAGIATEEWKYVIAQPGRLELTISDLRYRLDMLELTSEALAQELKGPAAPEPEPEPFDSSCQECGAPDLWPICALCERALEWRGGTV